MAVPSPSRWLPSALAAGDGVQTVFRSYHLTIVCACVSSVVVALAGCHRACAVGCVRPNDITACTTRFYASRWWNCNRCSNGFRSLNNGDNLGCTPGEKTDTSCSAAGSSGRPPPPPAPPPECRRLSVGEMSELRSLYPTKCSRRLLQTGMEDVVDNIDAPLLDAEALRRRRRLCACAI